MVYYCQINIMKSILTLFLFFLIHADSYAQEQVVMFLVIDNEARRDSIFLGVDWGSDITLGIDSVYGEENIYGTPFESLDIRVIQRDSSEFNCIRESSNQHWTAPNLYFPNNIDSKKDFRPFGNFHSENNNFEVFIHAENYPIIVYGQIVSEYADFIQVFSLNSDCSIAENEFIYSQNFQPLFTLPDSSFNTMVVNFQHEVSIDYLQTKPSWKVFPNPAQDQLKITDLENIAGTLSLIDLQGKTLNTYSITQKEDFNIELHQLQSGLYFIQLIDDSNQKVSVQKFIKN